MDYSFLMSVYSKVKLDELELSIESMLNQTIKPEQIVIVIDGPVSDEIEKKIYDYAKNNPDTFTILPLEENHGLAFALNYGIEHCRNELIARMDSDDYSLPTRCEEELNEFEKDKELAIVGTLVQYFNRTIDNLSDAIKKRPCDSEEIRKALRRYSPFGHPTVMYKKSCVVKAGLYDPELRRRQDYDLFSRMINGYNMKGININKVLLYYRADDDYVSRNKNYESCSARIKVQKKIFRRHECSLFDYVYILFAMLFSMAIPSGLYRKIYKAVKTR